VYTYTYIYIYIQFHYWQDFHFIFFYFFLLVFILFYQYRYQYGQNLRIEHCHKMQSTQQQTISNSKQTHTTDEYDHETNILQLFESRMKQQDLHVVISSQAPRFGADLAVLAFANDSGISGTSASASASAAFSEQSTASILRAIPSMQDGQRKRKVRLLEECRKRTPNPVLVRLERERDAARLRRKHPLRPDSDSDHDLNESSSLSGSKKSKKKKGKCKSSIIVAYDMIHRPYKRCRRRLGRALLENVSDDKAAALEEAAQVGVLSKYTRPWTVDEDVALAKVVQLQSTEDILSDRLLVALVRGRTIAEIRCRLQCDEFVEFLHTWLQSQRARELDRALASSTPSGKRRHRHRDRNSKRSSRMPESESDSDSDSDTAWAPAKNSMRIRSKPAKAPVQRDAISSSTAAAAATTATATATTTATTTATAVSDRRHRIHAVHIPPASTLEAMKAECERRKSELDRILGSG
jgi:hypothetical protein